MDDLQKDGQPSLPLEVTSSQGTAGGGEGDGSGKLENGMTQLITAEAWNINSSGLMKKALSPMVAVPAPSMVSPSNESPGGVALKVAATVLQPICLGDSPVVLPIHLQMAGSAAPQVNQAATSPYLMTSQGPVSLPLVLEQQVFQHLNSPVLPQGAPCPTISLQNNVLCHNSSLSFSQPSPLDQKPAGQAQEPGVIPLLQTPGLAAILQDMFPSQNNLGSSTCHPAAPPPTDPFSSPFFPQPPLPHPYSSLLSPLVPPATLLVPYPVIVPLPVPLPIPIPVPIPIPPTSESKGFADPPRPVCTMSKSTQTNAKEIPSPSQHYSREMALLVPQLDSPSSGPLASGEVLDLSMKSPPFQTKQEVPVQQDSVLDLSVASVRKPCIQSYFSKDLPGGELDHTCRSGEETAHTALSLEVLRPLEHSQKLDSKILNGLASLEFSRQHKWVMDGGGGGGGRSGCEPKCSSGNFEIVSTSQTAKVIVSVKDAVPAIFCGKIKGLSGVSTKNFSIKQDANQQAVLQQCYERKAQAEQRDPNDPLKKTPKNRAIKLKKHFGEARNVHATRS
ncbi:hypothetical protein JZ751_029215 [Albula glossodonta]|uniref:Retinoic acid induced 2 n=1 Tax=Albula glossodonta TaxID=121402 RepID=A0A8T2PHE7_9TELE|nr:hypothetical protein JZ751_029215 [Albula glossodonta]